jgi:hypothetical protein
MGRELVWIERGLGHWRCSECAWVFNLPKVHPDKSFEEMMGDFQVQRDNEFISHVCADYPRTMGPGARK